MESDRTVELRPVAGICNASIGRISARAVSCWGPRVPPSLHQVRTVPSTPVMPEAGSGRPSGSSDEKPTLAPATGAPRSSTSLTTTSSASRYPGVPVWPPPRTSWTAVGVGGASGTGEHAPRETWMRTRAAARLRVDIKSPGVRSLAFTHITNDHSPMRITRTRGNPATPQDEKSPARDARYAKAAIYARRALAADLPA